MVFTSHNHGSFRPGTVASTVSWDMRRAQEELNIHIGNSWRVRRLLILMRMGRSPILSIRYLSYISDISHIFPMEIHQQSGAC